MLVNYEPALISFNEWWKQLYGESEGKDNKGLFPAGVSFTTDFTQWVNISKEGRRDLFETVINVEAPRKKVTIEANEENLDGLNFLAGKEMDYVK